jgi:hypothetical protein
MVQCSIHVIAARLSLILQHPLCRLRQEARASQIVFSGVGVDLRQHVFRQRVTLTRRAMLATAAATMMATPFRLAGLAITASSLEGSGIGSPSSTMPSMCSAKASSAIARASKYTLPPPLQLRIGKMVLSPSRRTGGWLEMQIGMKASGEEKAKHDRQPRATR